MPPTISLCIPTYNRAHLLESALWSVAPQVRELSPRVELIIADNCSTDNTRDVVERFAEQCPLRYHRNDSNVGVVRNVLGTIENLAAGEFCWIIGDDDMLRDGALQKLLEAINQHPELDYFYVNYSIDEFTRREGVFVKPEDFRNWTRTGNENLQERLLDRWEALLGEDFNALTPIYASVFRRSTWLQGAATLRISAAPNEAAFFTSLDETFPHALVFARTMFGKPAWASGYPWVIMCGTESWATFIPVVVLSRFHELFDTYVRVGAPSGIFDRHRKRMFQYSADFLSKIIEGEQFPGLESFSLAAFVAKHYRRRELWTAMCSAALSAKLRNVAAASPLFFPFALAVKIWLRLRRGWKRIMMHLRSGHSHSVELK